MAGGLYFKVSFCVIEIFLCLWGVLSDYCGPLDSDILNLKRGEHWWFTQESCVVPAPVEYGNSTECLFLFSLCKPVPRLCSSNSGICETMARNNYSQISWPQDLGMITGAKFTKIDVNSFTYEYSPRDKLRSCSPLKTSITFQCYRNVSNGTVKDWIDDAAEMYDRPPFGRRAAQPVSFHFDRKRCELNIVFNSSSSEVCRFIPDSGASASTPHLSVGSILLILFFPSVLLYFFTGMLINASQGKSGKEMIPNYNFWTELPGLIKDGFGFTIAKITCSNMTTSNSYERM